MNARIFTPVAMIAAIGLAACGSKTETTTDADNTALLNFDAGAENLVSENVSAPLDAEPVASNSLDNAVSVDGNAN